jgi:large repetitive protein
VYAITFTIVSTRSVIRFARLPIILRLKIRFSHLRNYNYRWQLFDAGGNVLFNTYQNTDAEITTPTTGDYYLYLQGGADSGKIDYNFRVFAHNDLGADIITPGTGTGSTGADNLGLFNVKLGATDSRGASSTQDYQVKLWADPNNTQR